MSRPSPKTEQLAALQAVKAGQLLPIRLIGEAWEDDHILCCTAGIKLSEQHEVIVDLWWIGWEGVAALKYANESLQARVDALESLGPTIESLQADINDENEESDDE